MLLRPRAARQQQQAAAHRRRRCRPRRTPSIEQPCASVSRSTRPAAPPGTAQRTRRHAVAVVVPGQHAGRQLALPKVSLHLVQGRAEGVIRAAPALGAAQGSAGQGAGCSVPSRPQGAAWRASQHGRAGAAPGCARCPAACRGRTWREHAGRGAGHLKRGRSRRRLRRPTAPNPFDPLCEGAGAGDMGRVSCAGGCAGRCRQLEAAAPPPQHALPAPPAADPSTHLLRG